MRNLYQKSGALLKRFSVKVHDAVFRDDIMHQMARRRDPGSRSQGRDDFALAFVGLGGNCDDAFAVSGAVCPVNEVQLPADAGIHRGTDGVGGNLPRQINLKGGVDCHDIIVLRNDERIVRVADIFHQHQRIVIDEIIEFA